MRRDGRGNATRMHLQMQLILRYRWYLARFGTFIAVHLLYCRHVTVRFGTHAHFRTFPTGPTSEFRHGKNSSPHRQTIPVVPAPRDRQEWDFRYFQILVKRSREPTSATKDHELKKAKSFKSTCNSSFVNVNYWVRRHKQEKPTNPNAVT